MNSIIYPIKNKKTSITKDIFAGIIVALVSIPISMGYSQIAGLPVVYGLYGSILPIFVFALLTTSPQFVVGVDAMPAVMVGALLATIGVKPDTKDCLMLVPVVSVVVGVWFIIFYLLKAGRIVKYISKPVMGGFISGVGATIILMQVPKLFGGNAGTGELVVLIKNIVIQIDNFNFVSFILGFGTVVIILIFKKAVPKLPMTVIMMFVGAFLQVTFDLDKYGVKLLPEVTAGLPKFIIPDMTVLMNNTTDILLEALSIAAVVMAQTLLATGNYAMKYNDKVDNNRELLAYAGMNFAGAAVGCCPVNGSVSRSGIADSFGARSQLMSIASAFTMLMVLLFGTPYLKYLPVPILTGIVMTALIGILEIDLMKKLFMCSKNEWLIFMISFVSVLLFGTVNGVLIGCVLSFAEVAISATAPPVAYLGRIPGQGNYYDINRNSNARAIKGVVIYRFSGNLFFANIDRFVLDIEKSIKDDTKCVIVDARGIGNVDITSVDRLVILNKNLRARGVKFYITEHSGHLNDEIRILGGYELIEDGIVRRTITLALRDCGFFKPYILDDDNTSYLDKNDDDHEMLAEFEWAFGDEARERLEKLANQKMEAVSLEKDSDEALESIIHENRIQTKWGKLGRFEENEFWDFLELRLEKLYEDGKLDESKLEKFENEIELRRLKSEERLEQINPHALELLKKHRAHILEYIKENNPNKYEHIRMIQQRFHEDHEEHEKHEES